MALASLDVNFKEELSAIEQCNLTFPLYLPLSTVDSLVRFLQGSKFSRKPSAQPLSTVFCKILLKFRSAFLSPSFNRWPGRTP
jgi:hypothetical protein